MPPGRRRRLSDSTVELTDLSRERRPQSELSVFKPGPADAQEFDQILISIQDAVIYGKDGRTVKNPLHVELEGPLVLRGWVENSEEDPIRPDRLVRPLDRPVFIEVSNIEVWSIGDGPPTLWVAGKAGWWEINPAASFRRVYYEVLDAITLWYSVADAHEPYFGKLRHKKNKKSPPTPPSKDEVLLSYAISAGSGLLRDEAEARCDKWAQFLFSQFRSDTANPWDTTQFALWIRKRHPDIQKKLDQVAAGLLPRGAAVEADATAAVTDTRPATARPLRRGRTRDSSTETQDVEMTDASTSLPRADQAAASSRLGSKRSVKGVSAAVIGLPPPSVSLPSRPLPAERRRQATSASPAIQAPPSDAVASTAVPSEGGGPSMSAQHDAAADRYVEVLEEMAQENDMHTLSWKNVINKTYFIVSIKVYADKYDVVSYYANRLAQRLPEWKGTPFHNWLVATAQTPWSHPTLNPDHFPAQLVRRKKKEFQDRSVIKNAASPSTTLAPTTPHGRAIAKAALARKNIAGAKKALDTDGSSGDDDDDYDGAAVGSGQRSGKYPYKYNVGYSGLRLKRTAAQMILDDEEDSENVTDRGQRSGSTPGGRRRRQKAGKTSHPLRRKTNPSVGRGKAMIDDDGDSASGSSGSEMLSVQERERLAANGSSNNNNNNNNNNNQNNNNNGPRRLRPPHTSGQTPPLPKARQQQQPPVVTSTGPNGAWVCDQEGCGYVVRAGETEPGQRAIREHLHHHKEAMMKIEQVQQESGQNGRLQINHLLERIQAKTKASAVEEQQTQQQLVGGQPVPQRIRRMFL